MKKVTIGQLVLNKQEGKKSVMVTAYDYPGAYLADQAGVDLILVGDSLGNVVLGYDTTIPVTMEDMIHHIRPVAQANQGALIIGDMPYGSYQISTEQAIANAIRLIKEGGADAIKLEGGAEMAPLIKALTAVGVPVMAHIGLLPQTASLWEGYRVQGKDEASAHILIDAAEALAEAGAFAIVLECVTLEVAKIISETIDIPTIGIGSGPHCDGQVLVFHDLLGLNQRKVPRFVKQYCQAAQMMSEALKEYAAEVRQGVFPDLAHSVAMDQDEARKIY